ncbi:hypothetical protein PVAP13_2KG258516 [Panicum virgatum]|uniref:Uncharacterized protein n=1 Tax=Panicum virgatum TaxID=38727 RepID=A0A8T0WBT9_PANVG|nr:hypothetical protein PVAP13_2KG258516 [Panicum virgatum]
MHTPVHTRASAKGRAFGSHSTLDAPKHPAAATLPRKTPGRAFARARSPTPPSHRGHARTATSRTARTPARAHPDKRVPALITPRLLMPQPSQRDPVQPLRERSRVPPYRAHTLEHPVASP